MCRLSWNLGASNSWNPQGLSRPVMGLLYLYLEAKNWYLIMLDFRIFDRDFFYSGGPAYNPLPVEVFQLFALSSCRLNQGWNPEFCQYNLVAWTSQTIKPIKSSCYYWADDHFVHHHHHVQEGLGSIPVPCILKMKLVPPSLPRSSYVSSSFWFIL
jgi:hypothetical protein